MLRHAGCRYSGALAMAPTRRAASILAADVAGYSRLMGADEEGTHERLQAHLREVVDPKMREYRGRIDTDLRPWRTPNAATRSASSRRWGTVRSTRSSATISA